MVTSLKFRGFIFPQEGKLHRCKPVRIFHRRSCLPCFYCFGSILQIRDRRDEHEIFNLTLQASSDCASCSAEQEEEKISYFGQNGMLLKGLRETS